MKFEEAIDFIIKDCAKAGVEVTREEARQILLTNYAIWLEKWASKRIIVKCLRSASTLVIIGLVAYAIYEKVESKKTK